MRAVEMFRESIEDGQQFWENQTREIRWFKFPDSHLNRSRFPRCW